ncbi:MAG: basic amino acid ABC transporter substrate-binding protein [archaeon]
MRKKEMRKDRFIMIGLALLLLFGCTQNPSQEKTTDRSLLDIKERGNLIVGSDIPWKPMEFIDDSGSAVGFDIDVATEIAKGLGVSIEIVDYPWDELFDSVKTGKVDFAISGISITPERMEEYLFSDPYLDVGQSIIIRKDDARINSSPYLKGKKIGAISDTTSLEEAIKLTESSLVTEYDSYEYSDEQETGIIYDLKSGKIDAVITDYAPAKETAKDEPTLKVLGEPLTQEYYGIMARKDSYALMNEVNKILKNMKTNGKYEEIKNKWLQ